MSFFLSQACVIAFTSEFVPREIYRTQHDGSLSDYIDYSLSWFNTSNFETIRGEAGPNDDRYPVEEGNPYYDEFKDKNVTVCR